MIGSSNRDAHSRARRQAWWNSLTEEQKALEGRRRAEENRLFVRYFLPSTLIPTFLAIYLIPGPSPLYGLAVLTVYCLSMFVFSMWVISKYKKIK